MGRETLKRYGAVALWGLLAFVSVCIGLVILPAVMPAFNALFLVLFVVVWAAAGAQAIVTFIRRRRARA
jgi:hypothetical protein